MPDLIVPTNSGQTQQTTLAQSYFTGATGPISGAIRGDSGIAGSVQPVFISPANSPTPYTPDWVAGDEIFLQLGLIDTPPSAGTFNLGVLSCAISSVNLVNNIITTSEPHLLSSGNTVWISGSNTTPSIDGIYTTTNEGSSAILCAGMPTVTGSAAGGNIYLISGTGLLQGLSVNVPAATLQTQLNFVLSQLSLPACSVLQESPGVFQFTASSNGAIPSGTFRVDPTYCFPTSQAGCIEDQLGSTFAPYIVSVILEQAPFAHTQYTTALPSASIASTIIQAGSTTANQINQIAFGANNTYGGAYTISLVAPVVRLITSALFLGSTVAIGTGYPHGLTTGNAVTISLCNLPYVAGGASINATYICTVLDAYTITVPFTNSITNAVGNFGVLSASAVTTTSTCGIANPGMTSEEIASLLSNHPSVYYNNTQGMANNIIVQTSGTQSWTVQFTGTLGYSSVPTISVPSNTLVAPMGVSGILNYNTYPMYAYSRTQSSNSFIIYFSITRTRSSGESRTIFGPVPYTIFKDNLNFLTAIPAVLPGVVTVNPSTNALIYPTANLFFMANLVPWMQGLPASPPAGASGQPWMNANQLALT